MSTQYVTSKITTVGNISSVEFPKLIFVGKIPTVVATSQEQTNAIVGLPNTTTVIGATASPSVTVGLTTYPLILGRDFTKCVFSGKGKTYIAGRKIPPPVLSITSPSSFNQLSWTNSYGVTTRVWRTSVFSVSTPSTVFRRIAEIPGPSIPGSANSYIDRSIVITDPTKAVSYYVETPYGTSNTVQGGAVGIIFTAQGAVSISGIPILFSSGTSSIPSFLGNGSINITGTPVLSGGATALIFTGSGSVSYSGTPTIASEGSQIDTGVYAQVLYGDGVTAMTNRVLVVEESSLSTSYTDYSAEFTIIGTPTKEQLDDALLKVEKYNGGSVLTRVTRMSLSGTYI
jgi:hypothetical protein